MLGSHRRPHNPLKRLIIPLRRWWALRRDWKTPLSAWLFLGALIGASVGAALVPVRPHTNQSDQKQAEESYEKGRYIASAEEDANERLASYTLLLAVFTAALSVVALLQLISIWRGERTARLNARSALRQARIAQDTLEHLQLESVDRSNEMVRQFELADRNAKAAKRSADIAERAYIASRRPWLAVEVELTHPLTINESGCETKINITLRNVGQSPALKVSTFKVMLRPEAFYLIDDHYRAKNASFPVLLDVAPGSALFPGDSRTIKEYSLSMSRREIEAHFESDPDFDDFTPSFIVFASYALAADRRTRYTCESWQICRKVDDGIFEGFSLEPQIYSAEDLFLGRASISDIT